MGLKIGIAMIGLLLGATTALADWDPGDPYKMRDLQLPDWSVAGYDFSGAGILAEDWVCSASGWVRDLHFWIKVTGTGITVTENELLTIGIYTDLQPDGLYAYSRPNSANQLYNQTLAYGDWTYRVYDDGYQININQLPDPIWQTQDTIYWVSLTMYDPNGTQWQWITSTTNHNDFGVMWNSSLSRWDVITDVDFAVIITPEPTSIALLAVGGLTLLRRRHH